MVLTRTAMNLKYSVYFTLYGELGIATLFFSKNCDHGNHGYCGYHSNHGNHGSLENATLWLMQTLYFGLCGEI